MKWLNTGVERQVTKGELIEEVEEQAMSCEYKIKGDVEQQVNSREYIGGSR